jgi:hypothetical protein
MSGCELCGPGWWRDTGHLHLYQAADRPRPRRQRTRPAGAVVSGPIWAALYYQEKVLAALSLVAGLWDTGGAAQALGAQVAARSRGRTDGEVRHVTLGQRNGTGRRGD